MTKFLLEDTSRKYLHSCGAVKGKAPGHVPERTREKASDARRRAILDALRKTEGNRTQAAERLGIGLRTLQRKLKEYREAGKAEGY